MLNSHNNQAIDACNHYNQRNRMILNIKGKLHEWSSPVVMGILNVTPDSFYAGSRVSADRICDRAEQMLADGAEMIDIGGYSTRPGAAEVSADEELSRLAPAVRALRSRFPGLIISVDTFRAGVAAECIALGADIINDISGGDLDPQMWDVVKDTGAPYVLMHTRGTPDTMQSLTDYDDVAADVLRDLAFKIDRLRQTGVSDIIANPGFGFAKTVDQNYRLLASLRAFGALGCPLLAGMSRKTMVWKELGITAAEALNGTTAINMLALINGADILRVHDVKEAVQAVRIFKAYSRNLPATRRIDTDDRHAGLNYLII